MMQLKEVLSIHKILIEEFGGKAGIRDLDGLDAAIKRPFTTFDGQELYPTPVAKAAAILESVVKNHPFLDGNKRTGYTLMRLILLENGQDIEATEAEKYDFIIQIATGALDFEEIHQWLEDNLIVG